MRALLQACFTLHEKSKHEQTQNQDIGSLER